MNEIQPILQALLVADHVYKDVTTGKHIICGVFSEKQNLPAPIADGSPVEIGDDYRAGFASGSPFAYLSLHDIHGDQPFSLRYVRLRDEFVSFQFDFTLPDPNDRLHSYDMAIPLPKLSTEPGVYSLELLWNDNTPLGGYRITVIDHQDLSQ